MKKLYKYIVLIIGIVTFFSCAEEEFICSFGESGNDVTIKLKVQAQAKNNVTVSRAEDDEMLYDLHFYVFDQAGNLTGHEHFPQNSENIAAPKGEVSIKAKTGTSYIYAVANIDTEGVYYTISDPDKALLKNPDGNTKLTLPKLKEIQFNRTISDPDNNKVLSPEPVDKYYMMSGYINDGNPVNIQQEGIYNESGTQKIDNIVYLYRLLAKNTLNIKTYSEKILENGVPVIDEETGKEKLAYRGKFTPKLYRLCNVPTGGTLIPNTNISTTSQYLRKTVGETVTNNITEVDVESSYYENNLDSAFTFYYPENLQVAKSKEEVAACQAQITPESDRVAYKQKGNWVWKDRETNKWISDNAGNVEKKYIFADDNAAYIEIEGTYEYEGEYVDEKGETKNEKINANVTYTIHLGDFVTDIQDFNVIRNSNYTYTVVVNGVNDIIAEATKDAEGNSKYDNPYAEGLVIRTTTGEHYDVDAHYEARVMAFNLQELRKLQGKGFGYFLNIETPFDKLDEIVYVKNDGVYSLSNTESPLCGIHNVETIFSKENLFGWVRFVENGADKYKKNNDGSYSKDGTNLLVANSEETHVCRYPGEDIKKYSYTTKSNETVTTVNYAGGWMNAFELLAELYSKAEAGNTGEVYYTCFIDENYYANKLWSEYVNKEPRKIQIANKLSESPDGKSIFADAAYSVSQHSIATFYKNTELTAFGTEIIDEEDKFSKAPYNYQNVRMGEMGSTNKYTIFPPVTTDNEYWDGYESAVNTNFEDDWYSHQIQTGGNNTNLVNFYPKIQPLYGAVGKACMSRNRDNNGDGKIGDGEVRWYLASVQQYHALYIAKKSLPAESHLISDPELWDINTAYTTNVYGLPNTWNGREVQQWGGTRIVEDDPSGHDYRGKFHYYTSSPMDDAGTYWPEEGLTNNGVSESSNFVQRAELVRCVRTLGNQDEGLEAPDTYYEFKNNTFDLTGIDTWRQGMPVLTNHHELQPLNELSPKFMVAQQSLYSTATYSLLNLTGEVDDPCSEYKEGGYNDWRTPNQKEMALILAEIPDQVKKRRHGVRTRFSAYKEDKGTQSWHGPYSWHTRYGFSVETTGKFNVTGDNANVDIRCVRDISQ